MAGDRRGAVIIGGSGGIGAAVCARLAQDGFNIGLTYHKRSDVAERVAADARADGVETGIVRMSLSDDRTVRAGIDELAGILTRIDVVVYAAGPYLPQLHISRLEPKQYASQLAQDASGAYAVAHYAIPHLRESAGTFLSISTPAVRRHATKDVLSSAPKAAIEAMVRGIAVEEGRFGVRANAVGVGVITAGMHQKLISNGDFSPELLEVAKNNIPLRRFGTAQDVAEGIAFLASPKADWITGQVLDIDGGWSA